MLLKIESTAAGAPLGSIFGNLVAGFIANFTTWKWVFGVMGIVSGITAAAGLLVIPPPPPSILRLRQNESRSVDWIGGALITLGLLALMFALTEGNVVGWSTPWIPVLIILSFIIIALFVTWQWYLENKTTRPPLMKISIFRNKSFCAALVIMGLFFSSFNNFLVYATYFFQDYQGLSELQTTLRFIPTGVMGVITAFVVAQLLAKVPTYQILLFGNFCVSVSSLLFAIPISPTTSYFAYGLPAMILCVLGADTTWPSLTLFTSQSLPQADQALGGALINAVGQFGRAIGLAITTTVQTAVMARERGVGIKDAGKVEQWDDASLKGLRAGDWTTFSLGVCSFLVVALAFRGSGIVGRAGTVLEEGGGEEGIMNESTRGEDFSNRERGETRKQP